ncbi:MAG: preprotein translocase subunit SecG [Nibricoccus sp.]
MTILITFFTFVLILISLFLIFVVLMQKAKSDGGMGAAMGGGMAEAAFGAETGNVLTKSTIRAAIAFFVISFGLYLAQVYQHKHTVAGSTDALPTISAPPPTATAPATTAPAAPAESQSATPTTPSK